MRLTSWFARGRMQIADGHNLASGPAENSNSIEYYIETMHHRAARLLWLEMMQETIIEMFKICDETQMAKVRNRPASRRPLSPARIGNRLTWFVIHSLLRPQQSARS